ncbi:hypothetical protein OG21DRAFT_1261156 [Imleria badia]|nr:hypothetical protein OG21DRAFT_1261156 [Imleria badia]
MSSALQSALTNLQQNDYVSLAIIAAVGYDYVLTFSNEIDYIWSKPWTWVSTLFFLVRYAGLYGLVISALEGSSLLPGPAKVCQIIAIVNSWALCLFFGAADFVMILRVWAMYNRSRIILRALLALFSVEIISSVLAAAIQSNPKDMPAAIFQILDLSVCVVEPTSPIWTEVVTILQMVHGATMCILVIFQFVRQSLQIYRATKHWQLNRYTNLLVKQGIFYFLAIFVFNLINVLTALEKLPTSTWPLVLLTFVEYVPMFTLTPRFIMNIRELYARDVQGKHGEGIDTGFGLSLSGHDAGGIQTAIVFADVEPNEGLEGIEELPNIGVGTTQPV